MKKRKRKHNISLMELLTFSIFLPALLTFVFTFCQHPYIAKATLALWSVRVAVLSNYLVNPLCGELQMLDNDS